eukprot:scaffold1766_cov401-Prasinococcus_capsulatus_cf.AAC.8
MFGCPLTRNDTASAVGASRPPASDPAKSVPLLARATPGARRPPNVPPASPSESSSLRRPHPTPAPGTASPPGSWSAQRASPPSRASAAARVAAGRTLRASWLGENKKQQQAKPTDEQTGVGICRSTAATQASKGRPNRKAAAVVGKAQGRRRLAGGSDRGRPTPSATPAPNSRGMR